MKITARFICLLTFSAMVAHAGELDPSTGPSSGTMYTLEQIYNAIQNLDQPTPDGNAATAAEVVSGKTFWSLTANEWGMHTGAMPVVTLSDTSEAVSAGYYESTTLSAVDSDLAASNIAEGVSIFGITGSMSSGGGYGISKWPDDAYVGEGSALSTASLINPGKAYTLTNEVAGSFSWADDTIVPPAGNSSQWVLFTPTDTATFEITSNTITVTTADVTDGRWVDLGDGTVLDAQKGIMWVKQPHALPGNATFYLDWTAAMNLCAGLSYAGYDDWRLPSVDRDGGTSELDSLWGYGSWSGQPSTPFIGVPYTTNVEYWSGVTSLDNAGQAWTVDLFNDNGQVLTMEKNSSGVCVWPVRDAN